MSSILLNIERLSYGPESIAHLENGKTVFVSGGCPGDSVYARITEEKSGFARAEVISICEPSPARVPAACVYADKCGGCPWQHISYETQLAAKRDNVIDALTRIGKFDRDHILNIIEDTLPSEQLWRYRNKVEFETQAKGKFTLGFHAQGGHFIPIDKCIMLPKKFEDIPKSLTGALRYASGSDDLGIQRVGFRTSSRTKETEIALWTDTGSFPRNSVAKVLQSAQATTSLVRILLKGKPKERKVSGVEVLSGKGFWQERIGENVFAISAPSFFQVNTPAAEKLVDAVINALDVNEESRIFDLYSGAGTFTIPLAKLSSDVVAIESYASSVRDLRRNLEKCDVDAEVIGGDAARELPNLGTADIAVIDPPRGGLSPEMITALKSGSIEKIAYVSCNPTTLARDLKELTERYSISKIIPVDMFPQTYHVETVCLLTRIDKLSV